MSQKTLELLKARKAELEEEIMRRGAESSGHQRASIHDDAGSENALNLLRGTLLRIGDLTYVNIIQPNPQTDVVSLGNRIKVKFEDGEEEVTVLGQDDVIHRKDIGSVVSPESPLGKKLMGRRRGETLEIQLSKNEKSKIVVLDIYKGEF